MSVIKLEPIESKHIKFKYYQRGSMWVFEDDHGNLAIGRTLGEAAENYKVVLNAN